uniref:Uncharacterized protein n=1 Tax=Anguilla anguilla TaxID=7936 RepID=A0A0E9SC90_ANGAN
MLLSFCGNIITLAKHSRNVGRTFHVGLRGPNMMELVANLDWAICIILQEPNQPRSPKSSFRSAKINKCMWVHVPS